MMEAMGWISLSPSTDGEHAIYQTEDLLKNVLKLIGSFQSINQFIEVKELNGNNYLLIGINHNNGIIELVEQLIKNIGLLSKGCYGIVYVRDDESLENVNFRVIKLAKGRVDVVEDSLLSPCNPTIED